MFKLMTPLIIIFWLVLPVGAQGEPILNHLPKNEDKDFKSINAIVYAYNASSDQTDNDPCITADGSDLCLGQKIQSIANNCLRFGTLVVVGHAQYVVNDRMNERYGCEVFDVFMETHQEAKIWGKKYIQVKIIK